MASKSGMFLEEAERKQLIRTLESSGDVTLRVNALPLGNDTGCLVCGNDDDHNNLMLCEGCNDEYHTYCLDPPLSAVPHDDWFCDQCTGETGVNRKAEDDGLAGMVSALPREFTSRFGEVCFAYGGFGFGWWPSCIFDPRLTEGNARQTIRKNLGKKLLIYFFECHEAPFAVLSTSKIVSWHKGLSENYHLGKTARVAGKHRSLQFQQALHEAMLEEDKPLEQRLDWNRGDEQPRLLSIPKKARKKKRTTDGIHRSLRGKRQWQDDYTEDSRGKRREKKDGPFFCRILKRGNTLAACEKADDISIIGFVKLPSMKKSTFADARKAIVNKLVPEGMAEGVMWKFHVTTLGPVMLKQEESLGPILPFLRSGIAGNATNAGSIQDPITLIVVVESRED